MFRFYMSVKTLWRPIPRVTLVLVAFEFNTIVLNFFMLF
jgi:hypothetical protein